MSTRVRVAIGVAALSAILISCVPGMYGTESPASQASPAAPAAANPAAATVPVSAIQPTQANQPASSGANAVTTPVGNGTVAASGIAEIVFPAGSFLRLQSALRTQGTVPPSDLSPADLAKLIVEVDGRKLAPSEYEITKAEYNADGEIVLTIQFKNPPANPKPLRITSPDGRITLMGTTAKNGAPARVDVRSTAQSLLQQWLNTNVSDADRKAYEDAVTKSIIDLMTSSQPRKLDTDTDVAGLLQRIVEQVNSGKPLTKDLLALVVTPAPKTGGGGGGSSGPTLASVGPANLLTGAPRNLSLTGTGFVIGNTTVKWGPIAATAVTVNSTTQLDATITFLGPTPRNEAFTVTTPSGTSNGVAYNVAE